MHVCGCDSSKKAKHRVTLGVQVLRSPNLFKKNYSPQEAENAVISQRNHPVDIHIFHNVHATIAWPQQTLLQETLELERTTYNDTVLENAQCFINQVTITSSTQLGTHSQMTWDATAYQCLQSRSVLKRQTLQGSYNPIPLGLLLCITLLGTKREHDTVLLQNKMYHVRRAIYLITCFT